jgi:hypothetical protein
MGRAVVTDEPQAVPLDLVTVYIVAVLGKGCTISMGGKPGRSRRCPAPPR